MCTSHTTTTPPPSPEYMRCPLGSKTMALTRCSCLSVSVPFATPSVACPTSALKQTHAAQMSVTANDVGWCMGHALPFSMVSMPCRGATVHALRLQLPQCEALVKASRYEHVAAGRMKPGSVDVCGWSIATHTAQVHRSFLVCRDTPGTHCAIR